MKTDARVTLIKAKIEVLIHSDCWRSLLPISLRNHLVPFLALPYPRVNSFICGVRTLWREALFRSPQLPVQNEREEPEQAWQMTNACTNLVVVQSG